MRRLVDHRFNRARFIDDAGDEDEWDFRQLAARQAQRVKAAEPRRKVAGSVPPLNVATIAANAAAVTGLIRPDNE